ncbi:CHRD domain-containing protein [Sphingomicrobium marinum]|uniref:CHRD domain-containing protein n=1 Tax=Sphingomicrobium marinum TaxID=1227950 RepID=UPI002240913B|nr:CHRD domain-containing protein [Sphingomicrobium marinum]
MTKLMIAAGAALAGAVGLTGAALADHPYAFTGTMFETTLSGAAEVPGPGDPDGSGITKLWLNHGQSEICYEIMVTDIALPATGAHIHEAPAGSSGGVVVGLAAPNADGASMGCTMVDQNLIKEIRKNPADYYINIHNAEYPAGAVRGQLRKKNR